MVKSLDCGANWYVLLGMLNPAGQLLKMYQPYDLGGLSASSLSSIKAATWVNGTLYPLPLLGHITEGREYTLLPTPTAMTVPVEKGLHSFNGSYWKKQDGRKHQTDLYLTMLGRSLKAGSIIGQPKNGHILPQDVEWLMGYPKDWTKID